MLDATAQGVGNTVIGQGLELNATMQGEEHPHATRGGTKLPSFMIILVF